MENKNISVEVAIQIIKQAVQYGKYKAWNSEVGEEKAMSIMNDFHKGLYGSKCGMWIQVDEAIDILELLKN